MIVLLRCVCAAAVITAAVPAYAQSLGELARQEEARRATAKKAAIVLSNANLAPGEIAPPSGDPAQPAAAASPGAPCYISIKKGLCMSPEEMIASSLEGKISAENAPTESMWRQDAESLRAQIERTQRSIATLEAVVADQGRAASDRKSAERTLAAAQQSLARLERQWEKLETAAANKKIPRLWIMPSPTMSQRTPQ